MTDRELLERAAKAIGMYVLHERAEWPRENVGWFFNQVGGHPPALYDRANNLKGWFPLTDDGDALRLAVKRRQQIDMDASLPFVAVYDEGETTGVIKVTEPLGDDPAAATRRAIVRAAVRAAAPDAASKGKRE